jgi:hypothetical protein
VESRSRFSIRRLQWGPGVQPGRLKDPALQALAKELGAQNKGLCLITSRIALADLEALAWTNEPSLRARSVRD